MLRIKISNGHTATNIMLLLVFFTNKQIENLSEALIFEVKAKFPTVDLTLLRMQ